MAGYKMIISRLTVDKLGVKLYDKVSAVIAELISNSYDADARQVSVRAPMGVFLATKSGGLISDRGHEIKVVDDGIGMTPKQMQAFFLVVGAERRTDPRRGSKSPRFERKTMGRKGVGKLAPFGICKIIEVISAGGDRLTREENGSRRSGYLTSHVVLNYDKIVEDADDVGDDIDQDYRPTIGALDNTISAKTGTTITLKEFNYRRVPDIDTLSRQIAQRFGIKSDDWSVTLLDNTKSSKNNSNSRTVGEFDVQTMPNTRITFQQGSYAATSQVIGPDGSLIPDITAGFEYGDLFYSVSGWVAYAREPYKDDLMAGIRIYCRGKIAAQTSVFGRRAGFTGEHNVRSYLVGELHADWLDEDDDLIQTDRRDILWSDELGRAFQEWGQRVVQRIGTLSRDPMRKAILEVFLETGRVDERIGRAYPAAHEKDIRERAIELASRLGKTIGRAEAEEEQNVKDLVDLSITLAPHVTLDEMMRTAADQIETPLSVLSSLLRTARIAELSSFGRIAEDRLKIIGRLESLKDEKGTKEDSLQQLIEDAPWLINPEWAPVIANQSLNRLRTEFEKYYSAKTGVPISLSKFDDSEKRPDFVLSSQEGVAQVIEIKRPGHRLTNDEMERIVTYHDNIKSFLEDDNNREFRKVFSSFHITIVCDEISLTGTHRAAYDGYINSGVMTHISWRVFLWRTEMVHKDFVLEAQRQKDRISARGSR